MNHSTPPARRRVAAVAAGVLLALASLLICKPWATAASAQPPSAAVTSQQDPRTAAYTPAGTYNTGVEDLRGDRTDVADAADPASASADFSTTSGGETPGCQDDRRDDNGAQPSVPPRTGSSYDHGPLAGERAVPEDRAVPQVLTSPPAVAGPPLPPSTPVKLSVVQRV
ncbi:hypothetical protein [Streptomyces sp. NPDC048639]|uniref:hypothetical protein n=1 Tax=Streptomyces sp. NPDC048639 TaxID=3365581 RepID=UPI0037156010